MKEPTPKKKEPTPLKKVGLPPEPAPAPAPAIPSTTDADVDPTKKEAALSDAQFKETFDMTKAEFYALPKWKQQQKKKDAGLF